MTERATAPDDDAPVPTDRPVEMPPIDPPGMGPAILRSVGTMISWKGRYWYWSGVDWEPAR